MKFENVKKILILKLCCLGDIVFITPAIKSLKENFPDAEITLICSAWVENIIDYIPCVDKRVIYNPPFNENIFNKLKSAIKLVKILRKEKFDLVLNGHRTNYFGLILKLAGIRYRLGFSQTKYMNVTADFDNSLNETKRYLNILTDNDIKVKSSTPVFKSKPENDLKRKNNLSLDKKIIGIFPFGGINPGTDMNIKKWDIENYFFLVKKINNEFRDTEIILFEGKLPDEKIGKKTEEKFLILQINPELISVCDVFISGDTGPLHIAAAFGVSTISLFGPSDPRLVAPLNSSDSNAKHIYIWKQPPCSPCYTPESVMDKKNKKYWKGNSFICYTRTNECIKNITITDVSDELKKLLMQDE